MIKLGKCDVAYIYHSISRMCCKGSSLRLSILMCSIFSFYIFFLLYFNVFFRFCYASAANFYGFFVAVDIFVFQKKITFQTDIKLMVIWWSFFFFGTIMLKTCSISCMYHLISIAVCRAFPSVRVVLLLFLFLSASSLFFWNDIHFRYTSFPQTSHIEWLFVRGKAKPRIIESMSKCWKWRRYNNYWQKTGIGAWKFFRQRLAHSSVTSPDYILCECVYLTLIFSGQKTPEYK